MAAQREVYNRKHTVPWNSDLDQQQLEPEVKEIINIRFMIQQQQPSIFPLGGDINQTSKCHIINMSIDKPFKSKSLLMVSA